MDKLKKLFDFTSTMQQYENGYVYESLNGTKVFAFMRFPKTPMPKGGYPGMVFIHGGGGTAFEHIAKAFTDKGYAIICMDNFGSTPTENELHKDEVKARKQLPGGLPLDGLYWEESAKSYTEQWFYYALANCIIAHNILRSHPKVNAEKIAVAGVSWGGILTNVLCGIDSRFKCAISVYGCGYLDTPDSRCQNNYNNMMSKKMPFSPEKNLKNAAMPILFINSENDPYFPLKAWEKTCLCAPISEKCLKKGFVHNHEAFLQLDETWQFLNKELR